VGDRAHFVVKANGTWRKFYSQWAGADLELDLLPGPESGRRFAELQRPDVGWTYDAFCDGGVLMDFDDRLLLWFNHCHGDYAYRQAVLAVLARTLRAYLAGQAPEEIIAHGAEALATYALWDTVSVSRWMPAGGVHLDTAARVAGVWTPGWLLEAFAVDAGKWPGWWLELWEDRYTEQLERAGDAVSFPAPDLARGLRRLAAEFDAHHDADRGTQSAFLVAGFSDRLASAANVAGYETRVESHAFDHTPMDLTPEDIEVVHTAISEIAAAHRGAGGSGRLRAP
jgi:hypothetical protein